MMTNSIRGMIDPLKLAEIIGLESSDVVIEASVGDGFIAEAAAPFVKKIYAVDPDADATLKLDARLVAKDIRNVIPVNKGIEDIQIDEKADVCILANTFSIVERDEFIVIKKVTGLLRKGGRVIVIEYKLGSPFGPPREKRLDPVTVEGIFQGYHLDKKEELGLYHYVMIFRK